MHTRIPCCLGFHSKHKNLFGPGVKAIPRLLYAGHLGGIWTRPILYRLTYDTLSEYPEMFRKGKWEDLLLLVRFCKCFVFSWISFYKIDRVNWTEVSFQDGKKIIFLILQVPRIMWVLGILQVLWFVKFLMLTNSQNKQKSQNMQSSGNLQNFKQLTDLA